MQPTPKRRKIGEVAARLGAANPLPQAKPAIEQSALWPLVNLVELSLSRNSVTGISHLAPLSNLVVPYLGDNQIREIGALEHLANLRLLDLEGNRISDISALLRNPGLGEGDYVDLRCNTLGATDVQLLMSRGVTVW